MAKCFMKNWKGIICQYCLLIVAIMASLLCLLVKRNFAFSILWWLFIYVTGHIFLVAYNKSLKPSCKVLHLKKNEICMKIQFQNRRNLWNDFWSDFNIILKYAKEVNISTLTINTHSMILSYLLNEL